MTKAQSFINNLSPELQEVIKKLAEDLAPALDAIHAAPPTTKNYYGEYMRVLSYQPKYKKTIAIAMLYAGCNPDGVAAAVNLV